MKKIITTFCLSTLLFQTVSAQREIDRGNTREGENVEYCIQHKLQNKALAADPELARLYQEAQSQLEFTEKNGDNPGMQKGIVYIIPIVFHVLHTNGPENISDAQIQNALEILNRDFRKLNADTATVQADFQGMPADIEIEFRFAKKAPNGACFNGITRTFTSLTANGDDGEAQVAAVVAGNDIYQGNWPPNEYLNVFVCADLGGAAGYTFNPMGGTSMFYNSVFMLSNYVGAIGTSSPSLSRALTHEVGHWLNLSHPWGSNNNPGVDCDGSDQVTDTPKCMGVTSCNLNANTCNSINSYWTYDVKDNVENYMDYSYCNKMFTEGQSTRMRTALTSTVSGRNNLWTAANHAQTGIFDADVLCQARFSASKTVACTNDDITFTDLSLNAATGWQWTFTGGTPATSTAQNPTVSYSAPGTYTVTLTATDGTSSDTETKTAYITILSNTEQLPFVEGFEGSTTLNANRWTRYNEAGNQWTVTSTAGNNSSNSIYINNLNQTVGTVDELISTSIDLSTVPQNGTVTLSLRYAYRKKTTTSTDVLRVYASDDCGDSWDLKKTYTATLMNGSGVSPVASSFTPAAGDWITSHITNITNTYFNDNFRVKFNFTSNNGNNIFLDNINIYPGSPSNDLVTAGIAENENISGLTMYPNPSEGELNVLFSVKENENLSIQITDISGKVVRTMPIQAQNGWNEVLIGTQDMSAGMYFLNIISAAGLTTKQFVVK